jgi:hypothetical protein
MREDYLDELRKVYNEAAEYSDGTINRSEFE